MTTTQRADDGLAGLTLAGEVAADEAACRAASEDFGHMVHRRPLAVVRPGSAEDVVRVVAHARARGLKLAARGQGHSTWGQCQVEAGLVVELRALAAIEAIGEDRVRVGAGAVWRDVLRATLARGSRPPVLTDYLELSVGGTLSVGGMGNTSFREGAQVDNVLELAVVAGTGELVTCSPTQDRELFDAVLAGQGQCGIIVSATLRLVPAPAMNRVFHLFYADLPGLTRDLTWLAVEGRFESLSGLVVPSPAGGWAHILEAIGPAGDDAALLAGLGHLPGTEQIADAPFFAFADRITQQEIAVRAAGLWDRPHPWVDLFVPGSRVDELVTAAMAGLTPADVGPLPVMLYPLRTARLTRPLLRMPAEETAFLFDILRTAPPEPDVIAAQIARNRALYEQNRAMGGTIYPIGAVPMTGADWQAHFGPAYAGLVAAKARFDPDRVLGPGPGLW